MGVEETDAWDDAAFGVTSIEHWYGVPDEALKGSQHFSAEYNTNNESDRFRYAGRLWREADPEKLTDVLRALVDKGVSWCPVDGNALKNLKYLYPTGVLELEQGKLVRKGGAQWTIKDGSVYHAPTLLEEVKNLVLLAKDSSQ